MAKRVNHLEISMQQFFIQQKTPVSSGEVKVIINNRIVYKKFSLSMEIMVPMLKQINNFKDQGFRKIS